MEDLEKRFYYLDLFHLYGELLSDTQKDVLVDYLECDLSLSEIAANRKISRAAVEDAIKKGKAKLEAYEAKMQLYSKRITIMNKAAILREKFGNCTEIEEIEEVLK